MKKPKSKKQLFVERTLSIVLVLYVLITVAFPKVLFAKEYSVNEINFYFNEFSDYSVKTEKEETEFYKYLAETTELIKQNPFYTQKKNINVFFCSSKKFYALFSPLYYKSIGTNLTLFGNSRIVLNKSDFKSKTVEGGAAKNNTRTIKDTLVHEATHSFLSKGFPLLNKFTIPSWKEEGISEAISRSSSYDIAEGVERLLNGTPDSSHSYKYFENRAAVLYLINEEQKTYAEILKDRRGKAEILQAVARLDMDTIYGWLE